MVLFEYFLLIGNRAHHGTCVDSECYMENRHKKKKPAVTKTLF